MKCYLLPALLLALLLGITPLHSQTADQTEGCAPLFVSFTPPAGSSTFFWEFGDGVTSNVGNAQHSYLNPGTFTVNFREMQGGPILGSFDINVYPKPTADVMASVTMGCTPLATDFTSNIQLASGVNVFNYIWSYGDGEFDNGGGLENTSHTYNVPGNFTVGLELQTNLASCDATFAFPNIVSASGPPNVAFLTSPTPPTSCTAPFSVNFFNSTPNQGSLDFNWDFGNGEMSTETQPNDPVIYTSEGNFVVTLTATDGN